MFRVRADSSLPNFWVRIIKLLSKSKPLTSNWANNRQSSQHQLSDPNAYTDSVGKKNPGLPPANSLVTPDRSLATPSFPSPNRGPAQTHVTMTSAPRQTPFTAALLSGALAGTTVDLSLFPLDTLKTRLQSPKGFFPSGGFQGIYRGVGSALVGSAPGAALFFCTYEAVKNLAAQASIRNDGGRGGARGRWAEPASHMLAASLGEIAACAVRVPTEVVKQRAQAGQHSSSAGALAAILRRRMEIGAVGVWMELYRGWSITVLREVPFTVIQFPLWEALKSWGRRRRKRKEPMSGSGAGDKGPEGDVGAVESALYGSLAGAVAAGLTTPLDVLKTRVMLSRSRKSVGHVLREIWREEGGRTFFAGVGPRVAWISVGGAIFLGSYQWAVNMLTAAAV